jgi:hypothetical protein
MSSIERMKERRKEKEKKPKESSSQHLACFV